MKQETLEEAAEKQWGNVHRTGVLGFIDGAKWQKERMYSEEDIIEFANWCRIQDNKYPNRVILIQQLFEQFKNK